MRNIIRYILRKFGLSIKVSWHKNIAMSFLYDFNHNLGYDLETEANNAIKLIRKNSMLSYVKLVSLYQQAVYCEKASIEGSFVECGVWKGGAVGLMALANLEYGTKRRDLHLFDVFDNICEPDPEKDGQQAIYEAKKFAGKKVVKGKLKPMEGIYDRLGGYGSLKENKLLLEKNLQYPSDYLHYHIGWFQNTLPQIHKEIEKIAILHVDGDWYESVKICLNYLYPNVVNGGFIVIDDYGHYEGCTKAVNEYLDEQNLNPFLHHISFGARYWIKE